MLLFFLHFINILVCRGHCFITEFSSSVQFVFCFRCFLCLSNADIYLFQTDYTRHLEEIAKRTENVLLEAVQNCFVSGKTSCALEYLDMWENFVQLARQGKFLATTLALANYRQGRKHLAKVNVC